MSQSGSELGAVELKPWPDESTTTSESSSEDEKPRKKLKKKEKLINILLIKEYDDYMKQLKKKFKICKLKALKCHTTDFNQIVMNTIVVKQVAQS